MINGMTEEDRKELQKSFDAYRENKEIVKSINHGTSELLKQLAKKHGVEKKYISSAFKYAYTRYETGEDELDPISAVFQALTGNN